MPPAYLSAPPTTHPAGTPHNPGCTGKQQFGTPALAYEVVQRMSRPSAGRSGYQKEGYTRSVYRCRSCGSWHIFTLR